MALTGPVTLLASFEHHLHATNRAEPTVGNSGHPRIHALAAMLDRLRVRIAVQPLPGPPAAACAPAARTVSTFTRSERSTKRTSRRSAPLYASASTSSKPVSRAGRWPADLADSDPLIAGQITRSG